MYYASYSTAEDAVNTPLDSEGNILETKKNDADGNVSFELKYDSADLTDENGSKVTSKTFTYTLREKKGSLAGMTYDDTVYTVDVTVTDDLQGKLSAVVTSGEVLAFHNTYSSPNAMAVISAKKTLTGKALEADMFTFELVDSEGGIVTAKNDSEGNISFSVQFAKAGAYKYTLREKAGSEAGMSYDTAVYDVTVSVTADENGNLTAVVDYAPDDDATTGSAPTFKNSFAPVPIKIRLEGTKKLTGRDLKEEEFKFRVHDSAGNLVAEGTNTENGEIIFGQITLAKAGKYELTVSEVDSKAKHITYDTSEFVVTVDVTETDGVLSAKITYPTKGIVFRNTYRKTSVLPNTGDTTPIVLLIVVMAVSGTALVVILLLNFRKKNDHSKRRKK